MKKPLLYRLFRLGKLPKSFDASNAEARDEGIRIVTIYRNFKAPGKRFSKKKRVIIGSIVTTNERIIAHAYSTQLINLAFSDERLKKVDFSASTDTVLSMHFDVALFSDNASGKVTYEFHTDQAPKIMNQLSATA